MKYMMLVCVDEAIDLSAEEGARVSPEAQAWVKEMEERGVRVQGRMSSRPCRTPPRSASAAARL